MGSALWTALDDFRPKPTDFQTLLSLRVWNSGTERMKLIVLGPSPDTVRSQIAERNIAAAAGFKDGGIPDLGFASLTGGRRLEAAPQLRQRVGARWPGIGQSSAGAGTEISDQKSEKSQTFGGE